MKIEKISNNLWWIGIVIAISFIILVINILGNSDTSSNNIGKSASNYINEINNSKSHLDEFPYNYTTGTVDSLHNTTSKTTNTIITNENTEKINKTNCMLQHGKLQSFIDDYRNEKHYCVIKAKIEPSFNNTETINQNFFNVENFIKEQNGNTYDEIQYWAVADMTSGEENKVISFTLDKTIINDLYNEKIVANQLEQYLDDFWVLENLKK